MRRTQCAFLLANAIPLAVVVLLFPFTNMADARVYGQLHLGMVWAIAQFGLLIGSVWWHERRSTQVCDRIERTMASHASGPRLRLPLPPTGRGR
ncbi:hypothetical protein [Streptomyces sp. JJ38]|uniref:hypothetical protein n=1 Tax=Streptomyces sp. JJ38 TaxID=2738128 RepID=UPI00214AF048|nr:hypothetical protein [Streptomyces sp. JJ38]